MINEGLLLFSPHDSYHPLTEKYITRQSRRVPRLSPHLNVMDSYSLQSRAEQRYRESPPRIWEAVLPRSRRLLSVWIHSLQGSLHHRHRPLLHLDGSTHRSSNILQYPKTKGGSFGGRGRCRQCRWRKTWKRAELLVDLGDARSGRFAGDYWMGRKVLELPERLEHRGMWRFPLLYCPLTVCL